MLGTGLSPSCVLIQSVHSTTYQVGITSLFHRWGNSIEKLKADQRHTLNKQWSGMQTPAVRGWRCSPFNILPPLAQWQPEQCFLRGGAYIPRYWTLHTADIQQGQNEWLWALESLDEKMSYKCCLKLYQLRGKTKWKQRENLWHVCIWVTMRGWNGT